MDDKEIYRKMINELEAIGCIINTNNIENTSLNEEANKLLLDYLGVFRDKNLNIFVVRCLGQPHKFKLAMPLIEQYRSSKDTGYKWIVANSLYTIGNTQLVDEYISLCKDKKNGKARQMLVMLLGKCKSTIALDFLLCLLLEPDYDVLLHTISALKNYKCERDCLNSIDIFVTSLLRDSGKKRFATELNELKNTNIEYVDISISGFWKAILRECAKFYPDSNEKARITKSKNQYI